MIFWNCSKIRPKTKGYKMTRREFSILQLFWYIYIVHVLLPCINFWADSNQIWLFMNFKAASNASACQLMKHDVYKYMHMYI